jgi:aryl-alcohol dehydrogenase-like predicted oxidoreductase
MDYTTLGRTGLKVSVAGLGCGGHSRIGLGAGLSKADSVRLIRLAVDLGVNLLDTARNYGTEEIVGAALRELPRGSVIVSTKQQARGTVAPGAVIAGLDDSLRALGVDCIDVFHIHGLMPGDYDHVTAHIVPALLRERDKGKFRFLGVTESAVQDGNQAMAQRAAQDDCWDVMMLAFHMMHQRIRERVLPHTSDRHIGTMIMFAVRKLFSTPGRVKETVAVLAKEGKLPAEVAALDDPLGFLVHPGGAESVIDAAYRFARHEPGNDVVLFGTSSADHLRANIASLMRPPLPPADRDRVIALFDRLEGVGLDMSTR